MCPPRTDQTKIETTRTDDTEIEVKPSETCLTYQLQVISYVVIISGSIGEEQKCCAEKKGSIYETHSLAKGISAVAKPLR